MAHAAMRAMLRRMIERGRLTVVWADGSIDSFGEAEGPELRVRLTDKAARNIVLKRGLGLGEAYMNGDLIFERGDIRNLLGPVDKVPHPQTG